MASPLSNPLRLLGLLLFAALGSAPAFAGGGSGGGTVDPRVAPTGRAPVAATTAIEVEPGARSGAFAPARDPDGDPLALSLVSGPTKGMVSFPGRGQVVYAANAAKGVDAFVVRASDPAGLSVDVKVVVTIPNRPPAPATTRVKVKAGQATAPFKVAEDPNGDAVTVATLTLPKYGTIALSGGSFVYTARQTGATGDSFRVRATDAQNASTDLTVDVAIGITAYGKLGDDVVNGGAGDDTLYAVSGKDHVNGFDGDDLLTGTDLEDHLDGGAGDDLFDGKAVYYPDADDLAFSDVQAFLDLIDGGPGSDTVTYALSPRQKMVGTDGVLVNLATGRTAYGYAWGDRMTSIENVIGSEFSDEITGDSGPNRLIGRGGRDVIAGGPGDDLIVGDYVDGGSPGYLDVMGDHLYGDGGADVFRYDRADDSRLPVPDRIYDYRYAEGDRIDFRAFDGDRTKPGRQPLRFTRGTFTGVPGQLRISWVGQSGAPWRLEADVDGDRGVDFALDFRDLPEPKGFLGVEF